MNVTGHYVQLGDTYYCQFGANDTNGSGGDGSGAAAYVREYGAAASAGPVASVVPTLLTHVDYPSGCYEVAVGVQEASGFEVGKAYGVYCTLAIDSENPTGAVGEFNCIASGKQPYVQVDANDYAKVYDNNGNAVAPAATALTNATWTDARAAKLDNLDQSIATTESNIRGADSDTLKTLSDQLDAIPSTILNSVGQEVWGDVVSGEGYGSTTAGGMLQAIKEDTTNLVSLCAKRYECFCDVVYDHDYNAGAGRATLIGWLLENNETVTSPTSASFTIYTTDPASPLWTAPGGSADANGVFRVTSSTPFSFSEDEIYSVLCEIVYGGVTHRGIISLKAVD